MRRKVNLRMDYDEKSKYPLVTILISVTKIVVEEVNYALSFIA